MMPKRRPRRRLPVQLPPTRIEEQYAAAIIRAVITVMHWAYAPLIAEAPKLAQQRLEAKRAHADAFNPDEPRDEDGRWSGEGGSPTEVRRSYTTAGQLVSGTTDPGFELLQSLKREGHVYRGMTEAEYRNTVGAGRGVHSTNAYSASTEGTNFAADPDSAEGYVNGGRDLPVKTARPTYLVEAKGTGLWYNRAADAWQTPIGQGLPHDQVTRVWKMEKDGDSVTIRRIPIPTARNDAAEHFDSWESRRVASLIREAARRMRMHLNKRQIAALAKKFAEQTNTHQRIQLGRQLHEVMAIDVPLASAFAENRIADFVRENVALISSIPQQFHPQIETMVHHAVTSGRLAPDLTEDITDLFGVADRRARMIARDQIGKLTADLNHQRQRDLGVQRFVWRTMQDERVRGNPGGLYPNAMPSHFDLNGKTFSYDNPPTPPGADGPLLPGEDYNCRCYAEPVLDDLIDDAESGNPDILSELGEDLS